MQNDDIKPRGRHQRSIARLIVALGLLAGSGLCLAEENMNLLRGEVVFAVNCGRCHINATAQFETPPGEMAWLFRPTSPVVAHREVISEQDLQSVLEYLEDRQSRAR